MEFSKFTDSVPMANLKELVDEESGIRIEISSPSIAFSEGVITIACESGQNFELILLWQLISPDQFDILKIGEPGSIKVPSGSSLFNIAYDFPLFSFSGRYFLSIFVFMIDSKTNANVLLGIAEFEVILLLGPFFSSVILLIFFIALLFILIQHESLKSIAFLSYRGIYEKFRKQIHRHGQTHNQVTKSNSSTTIGYLKIQCPDCRKKIIEGSAFCPFCGYHLRKFERYL